MPIALSYSTFMIVVRLYDVDRGLILNVARKKTGEATAKSSSDRNRFKTSEQMEQLNWFAPAGALLDTNIAPIVQGS